MKHTLGVYCLKDAAIDQYVQPFYAHNDGHANRMFNAVVQDTGSEMHKHPQDFTLYHLADFNVETGKFTSNEPRMIARATDHIRKGNGQ